jgi:tetratricopeptide (TPR) repeat protein
MAQAPSPATKSTDLPTIIIDPSAYEPDRPPQTQTLYDNFIRLTRVTLAATAVGTATFGVAHVLDADSLLPSRWVSILTTALPREADAIDAHGSARAQSRAQSEAEDRTAEAAARPPELVQPSAKAPEETPDAPEALAVEPAASALPAAEPLAPVLAASADSRATAALPAASDVSLARPTTTTNSAPIKPGNKTASVQEEIRNARRLLANNRLEQAEAAYRGVLTLNEREPAALTGLARVQLARGELDDALASALNAVEKAPGLASAQLTLGDVLRARGDKTGAQAHYDQAAQTKPAADAAAP